MKIPHDADEDRSALAPLSDELVGVLVDNHRHFKTFLAKRVGSEALAEDLLQSSLKKALESPIEASEKRTWLAWFYQILRNTLIDHYRAQSASDKKNEEFLQSLVDEGRTAQAAPDELEAAICECMNRLLPTLKDSYAELIRRVDLGGESVRSVAQALKITENNLSVRLHRAREALRISLVKACGTCTEHGCLDCTCD